VSPLSSFVIRHWRECAALVGGTGDAIAKLTTPAQTTEGLSVRERVLLLCIASGTDWAKADVTGAIVTAAVVKGLVDKSAEGDLALTDRGRAVYRTMLPDL
jgi:hypothetical protein